MLCFVMCIVVIFDFENREILILKNEKGKLSLYSSYGRI